MEKGRITITGEQNDGKFVVHVQFCSEIWLTDYEIAHLFNVHISSIQKNIQSIFKSKLLFAEREIKEYSHTVKGKKKFSTLYSFEVLLFLAYRIDSCEVRAFRDWVTKKICHQMDKDKEVIVMSFHKPQIFN